jgi:hypothetical protein
MKAQKVFEIIKRHHPTMGGAEIVDVINEGVQDLCKNSGIFKQSFSQSTTAGQRYYTLDANIFKILSVTFDEVEIPKLIGSINIDDDELIETGGDNTTYNLAAPSSSSNERFWYADLGRIAVVEKKTDAVRRHDVVSQYQSISVVGLLRLKTIAAPADLTTTTIATDNVLGGAQGNFGAYIGDYGVSRGYANPESLDPQKAEYFYTRYQRGLKEAKKLARASYGSTGRIAPVEF